jgi:hypothetical protein
MMQPVNTDYGGKMLDEVARVLKQRADSAQLAGIPRWNIILDAGTQCFRTHTHTHRTGLTRFFLFLLCSLQALASPRRPITTWRSSDGSSRSTVRYSS